ncbi:MAG: type IV pilus biogenesis/stability protein PilW [Cellvibrio sp.]|uniref:type IV pilus biogenesis/stability protein PilW n=1 Tax=Cellvibrio sp. TaxID=1965322 RepID=UPI0031A784B2
MKMNNFIRLLKLALVSVVTVTLLAGCASSGKTGKANRQVDKTKSLELHIKLAQGYIDKGNRESARHHLRKAAEISSNSPDATEAMARLYQLEGESVLAEETFKKAIKQKKNFTLANNNYGVFLFGAKRYEEALKQFELAASDLDYDGRASALVNVGRTALLLGKNERAKAAFEHASVLDRGIPDPHIELAEIAFQKQEYADAKKHLDRYQALGQQSPKALLLGIRLERIFGNKDKEASYLLVLKNRFPYSKEYLEYKQTMM